MAGFMANQLGMRMLAPARRISMVTPVAKQRTCALVFDESPCAAGDVTAEILSALSAVKAKATFVVYGSTAENYPDRRGKAGKESWRGVRYAHLPDLDADADGGATEHPELLRKISAEGHELAVSGFRMIPASKRPFSRRVSFTDAPSHADDLQRILALTEAVSANVCSYLPPMEEILLPDSKSVYDVCNAFSLNCLDPYCDFGHRFFTGNDPDVEAKRIVRSIKARLASDPACFDGKLLRFSGGICPTLKGAPTPSAIVGVLKMLTANGYRICSVRSLLADSPFEDIAGDDASFVSAKAMLEQGYTVASRGNKFRPDAPVTREALYTMLVPKHIMCDYMRSRLYRTTAAFELNHKSEKDFYMAPGMAASAGMFYAYALGWPLERRQNEMTTRTFAAFLEKVSAGRKLQWTAPSDAQLRRKDVIDVLWQFISEEEIPQNGEK